jgi:hypothetical protein
MHRVTTDSFGDTARLLVGRLYLMCGTAGRASGTPAAASRGKAANRLAKRFRRRMPGNRRNTDPDSCRARTEGPQDSCKAEGRESPTLRRHVASSAGARGGRPWGRACRCTWTFGSRAAPGRGRPAGSVSHPPSARARTRVARCRLRACPALPVRRAFAAILCNRMMPLSPQSRADRSAGFSTSDATLAAQSPRGGAAQPFFVRTP